MILFTGKLLAFRHAHPVFRRRRWFQGQALHGQGVQDVAWLTPAGKEMSEQDWSVGFAKSLMVFMNGKALPSRGPKGEAILDDTFLLCFNAHYEPLAFQTPDESYGRRWRRVIDTADPDCANGPDDIQAGGEITLESRSMMVLQLAE
jgi:isoamylase